MATATELRADEAGSDGGLVVMSGATEPPAKAEPPPVPFLFSDETMERLTDAEKRGEYTLERLLKVRPEAIDEIIKLRGQFVGMLRIAKMLGVHHKTVAAVDASYPEEVEMARSRRIGRLRNAADLLVEQIFENPGCVPGQAKALAASQLFDKAELLEGRATARVEHVERVDIYSDWPAFMKQLQADEVIELPATERQNAIDIVSAVNVSETGLAAGKKSAIAAETVHHQLT